jgi:hypothetical protein
VVDPGTTTTTTSKNNVVAVELDTPFLFHVAEHFFVGFGPTGFADILNAPGGMTNLRRVWGAASTVGGWF